jgi:hypothetical protein
LPPRTAKGRCSAAAIAATAAGKRLRKGFAIQAFASQRRDAQARVFERQAFGSLAIQQALSGPPQPVRKDHAIQTSLRAARRRLRGLRRPVLRCESMTNPVIDSEHDACPNWRVARGVCDQCILATSHSGKRRSGVAPIAGRLFGETSGVNGRSSRSTPYKSKTGKTRTARPSRTHGAHSCLVRCNKQCVGTQPSGRTTEGLGEPELPRVHTKGSGLPLSTDAPVAVLNETGSRRGSTQCP